VRQNAKNKLARPRFYWVEEMEFRGCDKSGRIVNFSEEPRQFEPRATMMMAKGAPMFEANVNSAPQLESGEQKITSSVLITYEIE